MIALGKLYLDQDSGFSLPHMHRLNKIPTLKCLNLISRLLAWSKNMLEQDVTLRWLKSCAWIDFHLYFIDNIWFWLPSSIKLCLPYLKINFYLSSGRSHGSKSCITSLPEFNFIARILRCTLCVKFPSPTSTLLKHFEAIHAEFFISSCLKRKNLSQVHLKRYSNFTPNKYCIFFAVETSSRFIYIWN